MKSQTTTVAHLTPYLMRFFVHSGVIAFAGFIIVWAKDSVAAQHTARYAVHASFRQCRVSDITVEDVQGG